MSKKTDELKEVTVEVATTDQAEESAGEATAESAGESAEESLKSRNRRLKNEDGGYITDTYGALDLVKDILFCVLATVIAFGWMMLMLLLISFMTLGVLHFRIEYMLIASAAVAAVVLVVTVLRKFVLKRTKH